METLTTPPSPQVSTAKAVQGYGKNGMATSGEESWSARNPGDTIETMMRIPTLPFWMFEFLVCPAEVWIWICAKLCGVSVTIEQNSYYDADNSTSQE